MEIQKRKTVIDDLKKYTFTSDENAYIEITEWTNGEGWDINISDQETKSFSLHCSELEAIIYLTKHLDYND